MPEWAALRAELLNDPTGKGYAAMADDAAAAALNAPGAAVQGVVPPADLLRWGAKTSVRQAVEANVNSATVVGGVKVASVCLAVRDMLGSGAVPFDSANADNQAMCDVLTAAGVMPPNTAPAGSPPTPGSKADLLLLGQSPGPSRALQTFGAPVGAADVHAARS